MCYMCQNFYQVLRVLRALGVQRFGKICLLKLLVCSTCPMRQEFWRTLRALRVVHAKENLRAVGALRAKQSTVTRTLRAICAKNLASQTRQTLKK